MKCIEKICYFITFYYFSVVFLEKFWNSNVNEFFKEFIGTVFS